MDPTNPDVVLRRVVCLAPEVVALLAGLESKAAEGAEATVLAELLGLRTILLKLILTVAKAEVMTAEQMQTVIERGDAGKLGRVRKLLAAYVAAAPELPPEMKVQ